MPEVHKHVHIEWRGGTCRVKWWSGEYLAGGRKRYESKGGFTDEETATQHGLDKLYEIRHGTHVKNRDGATPMPEWCDAWMDSMDVGMLTEKNYRDIIKVHIKPYFERMSVADVDVITYRAFRKHIATRVGKGRASNVMMILGMILDDAVPRLIKVSPVERNRKRGRFTKKPKERKRDLSVEVVDQLARNAEVFFGNGTGKVLVWTMAMTGMRPGELFGLPREYCYPNWPASDPRLDEDEEERYADDLERYGLGLLPAIRVQQQTQYHQRKLHVMDPKYDSKRTLVIPPFLAEMLKEQLASHDGPWVFPALMGGSLAATDFDAYYWRSIADGVDERGGRKPRPALPEVPLFKGKRMYLLRHGHKAWLDEDGHSRFAVESRMGHEVGGVEGTYSSVTVPMERAIMDALQKRWETFQARGAGCE
ncbi:tyrosine-type recombinase/integrase [Actinacidiphila reveromycinica]|uniref:tyrosine-type recombinase/integrase n=1 Tax=Actinacidiphila reveromycinica TaxID=659352 RepID=UPI001924A9C0|nr:integrase [Streptomyces sp. SN-593]